MATDLISELYGLLGSSFVQAKRDGIGKYFGGRERVRESTLHTGMGTTL